MDQLKETYDSQLSFLDVKACNDVGQFLLHTLVDSMDRLKKPIKKYWLESEDYRKELLRDLIRVIFAASQIRSHASDELPLAELLSWPRDIVRRIEERKHLPSIQKTCFQLEDNARHVVYLCLIRPEWSLRIDFDRRGKHDVLQDSLNESFTKLQRSTSKLLQQLHAIAPEHE